MTPRKNKSPAFQFYPKDFLVDTMHLDDAQVGAYIRLISYAWIGIPGCAQTEIPSDVEKLARLVTIDGAVLGQVIELFKRQKNGNLRHPRLAKELKQQRNRSKQAREAGLLSAKKRQRALNELKLEAQRESNSSSASASASSSASATAVREEEERGPDHILGEAARRIQSVLKCPEQTGTIERHVGALALRLSISPLAIAETAQRKAKHYRGWQIFKFIEAEWPLKAKRVETEEERDQRLIDMMKGKKS